MVVEDADQARWNEIGRRQSQAILANPEQFRISPDTFPMPYRLDDNQVGDLLDDLGPLHGKKVLELGCGYGKVSVYLAKRGADITATDLGFDLVGATRDLAAVNDVPCLAGQADIRALPFRSGAYDAVVGLAVLHHLPPDDVTRAVTEAHRVLRPGGVAVFYETVENSRVFDFLQKLLPARHKEAQYRRPSMLQRRAWREHQAALDEREMTYAEFRAAGKGLFRTTTLRPYGLLVRLDRLFGTRVQAPLKRVDRALFAAVPRLKNLARFAFVVYRK